MTLRSLSHNLALSASPEVDTRWYWLPFRVKKWALNLLLLPWPDVVVPDHFRPATRTYKLPGRFGLFTCDVRRTSAVSVDQVERVVRRARQMVGRIDGIVFPELTLRDDEHIQICQRTRAFVVAGLGSSPAAGMSGENRVGAAVPVGDEIVATWRQDKHHRWRVDSNQIAQYGLGSQLDPEREWWEDTPVGSRTLYFWQINGWLTLSVLICEDLARQDPVSNVVRSIGPNLVVALLMDGPQLASRWPARYATVLADDPGCSVLTVTSVGMALLSRVPGKPESRVVALWKDAASGKMIEIELEKGAAGVVISLTRQFAKEWTADGRNDRGATGYVCLNGIHQVRV